MSKQSNFTPALLLGIASGMRTFAAPALLGRHFSKKPSPSLSILPFHIFQSKEAAEVLKIAAASELVVDKIPGVPDRIAFPGLSARLVAGSATGAVISKVKAQDVLKGACVGGLSALATAFVSFYLRKKISAHTKCPDAALGAIEDALVIAVTTYAINKT